MPKYELMYIVAGAISDDEIPKVADEVKKYIEGSGGLIEKHEDLGKKKLAYPIKKTRNGSYILDAFSAPSETLAEIEHKIRTSQNVIRHLILNMDDAIVQMQKDKAIQAKLKIKIPQEEERMAEKPASRRYVKPARTPEKKIQIDLDAEIEKALETPGDLK